jgi:hypothetical protein
VEDNFARLRAVAKHGLAPRRQPVTDSASPIGFIVVIKGDSQSHVPAQAVETDRAQAEQALRRAQNRAELAGREPVYELAALTAPDDGPRPLGT